MDEGRYIEPYERRYYEPYRSYEAALHLIVVGLLTLAMVLLFESTSVTASVIVGIVLLALATCVLALIIIGNEIWSPSIPDDVWREARAEDQKFESYAGAIDAWEEDYERSPVLLTEDRLTVLTRMAGEALSLYRTRRMPRVLRRAAKRGLLLGCIAVAFVGIARILVLLDANAYGSALTAHSSTVDYVYITLGSAVNSGDAGPISEGARAASILYAGVTLAYLLLLLSHVWVHEARRESLLVEYISRRYVDAGDFPPP